MLCSLREQQLLVRATANLPAKYLWWPDRYFSPSVPLDFRLCAVGE